MNSYNKKDMPQQIKADPIPVSQFINELKRRKSCAIFRKRKI